MGQNEKSEMCLLNQKINKLLEKGALLSPRVCVGEKSITRFVLLDAAAKSVEIFWKAMQQWLFSDSSCQFV